MLGGDRAVGGSTQAFKGNTHAHAEVQKHTSVNVPVKACTKHASQILQMMGPHPEESQGSVTNPRPKLGGRNLESSPSWGAIPGQDPR